MAETVTIDLAASGVTTAQGLRGTLAQQLQQTEQDRARLVVNQQQELAAIDRRIALFKARIGELDEFIAFKGAPGG